MQQSICHVSCQTSVTIKLNCRTQFQLFESRLREYLDFKAKESFQLCGNQNQTYILDLSDHNRIQQPLIIWTCVGKLRTFWQGYFDFY